MKMGLEKWYPAFRVGNLCLSQVPPHRHFAFPLPFSVLSQSCFVLFCPLLHLFSFSLYHYSSAVTLVCAGCLFFFVCYFWKTVWEHCVQMAYTNVLMD